MSITLLISTQTSPILLLTIASPQTYVSMLEPCEYSLALVKAVDTYLSLTESTYWTRTARLARSFANLPKPGHRVRGRNVGRTNVQFCAILRQHITTDYAILRNTVEYVSFLLYLRLALANQRITLIPVSKTCITLVKLSVDGASTI